MPYPTKSRPMKNVIRTSPLSTHRSPPLEVGVRNTLI